MLQGLFSDLSDAISMGISPEIAVPLGIGVLLAAAIVLAFFRYGSAAGSYNWQLGLLMATGVALSIASGWTTWDGMQNFTHEPVLALLITFGIQAVLLVVSFLIGESFANRPRITIDADVTGERAEQGFLWTATSFVGIAAGFVALVFIVDDWFEIGILDALPENFRNTLLKVAVGALAIALIVALCLTSGGNLFHRGIGLLRVAAQNATLWVMLIACLGASVFFSFDSLFSTIFPQDERTRASDIRTRGQISELVTDVKARALTRRSELQTAFSRSPLWAAYTKHLDSMAAAAERLPKLLEANASERFRQVQSTIGALEVDLASAQAQLQSLTLRGEGLREEAARVRASVQNTTALQREIREKISSLGQEISANVVESEKELNGLGASETAGRGPIYRRLLRSRKKLEFELKLVSQRLTLLEQQSSESQSRLDQAEIAVSEVDQQIAQQSVTVETARKLVDRATKRPDTIAGFASSTLLAEQLRQLELARNDVLRSPSMAAIDRAQEACDALAKTSSSAPGSGTKDWQSGCRTDELRSAATQVSQISLGLAAFEANCTADGKLPDAGGTRELISFARRCIQTSGMASTDIASFNDRVGSIALNRDDKAHRFVVTINAFGDGNRLAYLALAIALAIDGLVFASGIFYAQAARSPLSDIPGTDGRPQRELEHILDSALQPNAPESAAAALETVRPLLNTQSDRIPPGFTHEIDTTTVAPAAKATISKLLGAAAAIGAVSRWTDDPNRYLMRGEVVTYLSRHAHLSKGEQLHYEGAAALSELLSRVLADDVHAGAATVLKYFQPIPRRKDFATRVVLSEIEDESDAETVRKALNAAAVLGYVRVGDEKAAPQQYLLHRDVFVVLADLAAVEKAPSAPEPPANHEAAASVELQPKDRREAPKEPPAIAAEAVGDQQDAVKPAGTKVAPAHLGNVAGAIKQVGPFETLEPSRDVRHAQVRPEAANVSIYDRQGPRSPAAKKAKDGPGEAPQTQTEVTIIERPGAVSPAATHRAVEAQEVDEGSDPLDFGMDLSDPAFPETLFESLEDGSADAKSEAEDVGQHSKASRSPVGRD